MSFVRNCDCPLYDVFSPQIVFEIGSSPKLTFWVYGRSLRCNSVAPTLKLSEIL